MAAGPQHMLPRAQFRLKEGTPDALMSSAESAMRQEAGAAAMSLAPTDAMGVRRHATTRASSPLRAWAEAPALLPMDSFHRPEGIIQTSASGPLTLSQRSLALAKLPWRFSSSPHPCQLAACFLFATIAASNSCRKTKWTSRNLRALRKGIQIVTARAARRSVPKAVMASDTSQHNDLVWML